MKIQFQADANLDPDIWRGLCRREPSIDFEGHMGVIPDGTPDPEVLKLAADAGRVLKSSIGFCSVNIRPLFGTCSA